MKGYRKNTRKVMMNGRVHRHVCHDQRQARQDHPQAIADYAQPQVLKEAVALPLLQLTEEIRAQVAVGIVGSVKTHRLALKRKQPNNADHQQQHAADQQHQRPPAIAPGHRHNRLSLHRITPLLIMIVFLCNEGPHAGPLYIKTWEGAMLRSHVAGVLFFRTGRCQWHPARSPGLLRCQRRQHRPRSTGWSPGSC